MTTPLDLLKHHVTGAIERGEAAPVVRQFYPTRTNAELFLDWFNNFLSVERFAEYYGFSVEVAREAIETGRAAHEANVREVAE